MDEHMANRIAHTLAKVCPAFTRERGSGGAVWHHCHCKAQDGFGRHSCTCVWHLTDKCLAGRWADLFFVHHARRHTQIRAASYLSQARAAAQPDQETPNAHHQADQPVDHPDRPDTAP